MSETINGLVYTPKSETATLSYDGDSNVTGITSGSYEITSTDSSSGYCGCNERRI